MRGDHLKVKGRDLVEQKFGGRKPVRMCNAVLQALSDGDHSRSHAYLSLLSCVSVMFLFLAASRIAISNIAVRLMPDAWLIFSRSARASVDKRKWLGVLMRRL
jgi:hypothetical protein